MPFNHELEDVDWEAKILACTSREAVQTVIREFVAAARPYNAQFGFAYIALNRCNLDNHNIEWCLDKDRIKTDIINCIDDIKTDDAYIGSVAISDQLVGIAYTTQFLRSLMLIPEELRDIIDLP